MDKKPNENEINFRHIIIRRLKKKNMPYRVVAAKLNIDVGQFSKILKYSRKIKVIKLKILAEILELDFEILLKLALKAGIIGNDDYQTHKFFEDKKVVSNTPAVLGAPGAISGFAVAELSGNAGDATNVSTRNICGLVGTGNSWFRTMGSSWGGTLNASKTPEKIDTCRLADDINFRINNHQVYYQQRFGTEFNELHSIIQSSDNLSASENLIKSRIDALDKLICEDIRVVNHKLRDMIQDITDNETQADLRNSLNLELYYCKEKSKILINKLRNLLNQAILASSERPSTQKAPSTTSSNNISTELFPENTTIHKNFMNTFTPDEIFDILKKYFEQIELLESLVDYKNALDYSLQNKVSAEFISKLINYIALEIDVHNKNNLK